MKQEPVLETAATASPQMERDAGHQKMLSESLPDEADGFEWKEDTTELSGLTDGMAALSVEPTGTGYLGSTSGVVFLRFLLQWTKDLHINVGPWRPMSSPGGSIDRPSPVSQGLGMAVSHQLISSTLDAYFANYHTAYPFLHEPTFRAQYAELVQRPDDRTWHILLYTVLALGAWTVCEDSGDLDDVFYQKACSYLHDQSIFESASLSTVQALVLLSNYTQKRNKPNTGWNYLGLAVRMALSLGLHRELPEWNISLLQREMRRRVWWGLFIFDSGASITFGRAILLPEQSMIDVKLILNLLTPMTSQVPHEVEQPTIYSSLKAQSELHLAANGMSNRLLCTPSISASEALVFNKQLTGWAATVPDYLRLDQPKAASFDWYLFARSKLWWRYWNMQIILFRPIILQAAMEQIQGKHSFPSEYQECKRLCLEAAHQTTVTIQEYMDQHSLVRLAAWYTLYFLFHAALIHAVCLCAEPQSPFATNWQADLEATRTLLSTTFSRNQLASRILQVLDRLIPGVTFQDETLAGGNIESGVMDFSMWPLGTDDPLSAFGWPEYGTGG
ncbi:hypothetical protein AYO22_08447 [Fonsecaea multimorphosa]|nr:hypothetical protein AYO22_08447 [Fonsecaea multimorphosa]